MKYDHWDSYIFSVLVYAFMSPLGDGGNLALYVGVAVACTSFLLVNIGHIYEPTRKARYMFGFFVNLKTGDIERMSYEANVEYRKKVMSYVYRCLRVEALRFCVACTVGFFVVWLGAGV